MSWRTFTQLLIGCLFVGGLGLYAIENLGSLFDRWTGRETGPTEIIATTLTAVQDMNRLTVFAAQLVSIPTTSMARVLPMNKSRTLIAPATVYYEVDFEKLKKRDLTWDAETSTLTVNAPDVVLASPKMETSRYRIFEGGIAVPFAGDVDKLDKKNWALAENAVLVQARSPVFMRMARRSARIAISNNFRLPLEAAGLRAKVVVRFPGETGRS